MYENTHTQPPPNERPLPPKQTSKSHTTPSNPTHRLPTPFGLVRTGVAPDHPEVKSVQRDFEKVAEDPRFRCVALCVCVCDPITAHTWGGFDWV